MCVCALPAGGSSREGCSLGKWRTACSLLLLKNQCIISFSPSDFFFSIFNKQTSKLLHLNCHCAKKKRKGEKKQPTCHPSLSFPSLCTLMCHYFFLSLVLVSSQHVQLSPTERVFSCHYTLLTGYPLATTSLFKAQPSIYLSSPFFFPLKSAASSFQLSSIFLSLVAGRLLFSANICFS